MKKAPEQYWSMTEGVFNCLIDKERSIAFKKAILKTVQKNDVVVDMGTGSGILAMFAVKAGAKKVYAVEIDKNNIDTLRQTFEKNGLSEKISVISGDITKIKLPEKVDVVIGEMIATALIEELQVPAMNNVLKFTKKNFKVLLSQYETFLDVVDNNESYYGCDFKIIRYEYPDMKILKSKVFSKQYSVCKTDFSKITNNFKVRKHFDIEITRSGTINSLRLSGVSTFHDNSTLGSTYAYSYPIILPIDDTVVQKGDKVSVDISYTISGGLQSLKYSLSYD